LEEKEEGKMVNRRREGKRFQNPAMRVVADWRKKRKGKEGERV
jgi:hypothetical protein